MTGPPPPHSFELFLRLYVTPQDVAEVQDVLRHTNFLIGIKTNSNLSADFIFSSSIDALELREHIGTGLFSQSFILSNDGIHCSYLVRNSWGLMSFCGRGHASPIIPRLPSQSGIDPGTL